MLEKFELLVKNVGVLEAIKMMGGFNTFKEIAENNPQFKPYLDKLKGSCSVSFKNYPDVFFEFFILDADSMDDEFGQLTVDMIVDFKNLSGWEIFRLKQWMGVVADDLGFEIYDLDISIPAHVNLLIKSFNGKPYDWPGHEDVIHDEEAFELLDKTGKWEGMIRESINESVEDDLKVAKQRFFKIWDGRGYASVDDMMMKLFHVSQEYNYTVQDWVQEWNEINKVNPLKYLEEDGYVFNPSTLNPRLYFAKNKENKIEFREPEISGDVLIRRVDVDTYNKEINVWINVIHETITEPRFNGRTFEEMYPDDGEDDEYFYKVMNEYSDDFIYLTNKYFQKKYANKMGYELEMDFA